MCTVEIRRVGPGRMDNRALGFWPELINSGNNESTSLFFSFSCGRVRLKPQVTWYSCVGGKKSQALILVGHFLSKSCGQMWGHFFAFSRENFNWVGNCSPNL